MKLCFKNVSQAGLLSSIIALADSALFLPKQIVIHEQKIKVRYEQPG